MGLELLVKGSRMSSEANSSKLIEESLNRPYSEGIHEALDKFEYNFVITDPCLLDHPIVYASEGFLKMTGYSRGEVLGRNSRFLQGPKTDRRTVLEIREAIRQEKSCQVSILNYRKDGTTFWNFFHLAPVISKEAGRVIHFLGVQNPISHCFQGCRSSVTNMLACSNSKNCTACLGKDHFNSHTASASASNNLIYFGSCRREFFRDLSVDLGHTGLNNSFAEDDNKGKEEKHTCEPKESDKQQSATAVTRLLSELTHFSKYTGRAVLDGRCDSADLVRVAPISSSLSIALSRIQQSFVLADPHLPDMPIVYASNLFLLLTGYSRDEVLGKNCRFLQGRDTNQEDITKIRQSIETEQPCTVRLLNYRKNGNPFWNLLHMAPVRNASGKVAFYVGVQLDATGMEEEEHPDKGMTPQMKQLGAVGAVRVAVRSLLGPSR
uniref:Putative LOV domain-containing protein n=2 Tax=Araucariaceae TaxID=25664 RepID=A0A126WUJ7_9CONI|nr:putative LOV domain-containing protein [Araucaria sp. BC-2016]AML77868.1 putative LOV domain-containing protein [Agathis robusta]